MELGSGGITWFTYVPAYNGNRDLPAPDQISVEVRKLRAVDVMEHMGDNNPARLLSWLNEDPVREALKRHGMTESAANWSLQALGAFRQFVRNTRNFRNFQIDGQGVTDPVDVFLLCADAAILFEINAAINRAASLSGDSLKNYVLACAGSSSETMSRTAESSAPRAPGGNGQTAVSPPQGTTVS